jgi:phage baseplate assembly protein W
MIEQDYIGTGLRDAITLRNGRAEVANGRELIVMSMRRILGEPRGTRFFNRDFGSRIDEILFEPNDEVLIDLLRMFVIDALSQWERRARVETVKIDLDDNKLLCEVTFKVLSSNEIDSFVYPFYRTLNN